MIVSQISTYNDQKYSTHCYSILLSSNHSKHFCKNVDSDFTIRDVPDIWFQLAGYPLSSHFFESGSGSGSGQNGTSYRISQPDSARSFLAVSSPIKGWTFWFLTCDLPCDLPCAASLAGIHFWILIDLLWIVTVWLNTLNAKSGNAMLEWVHLNFKELVSHVDQLFYIY